MKILVTGATGLVGTRLLPRLVEDGHDCRAVVRRPGSVPPHVTEVIADLSDSTSLTAAVSGVEAIVHLAAVFRTTDTDLIWKTNRDGTVNLISAVQQHAPAARLIMASTAHIYDADGTRPGREDDPAAPTLAYPASKLAAENALRSSNLTWTIQRYGFVYGDGDGHLESLPAHATSAGMHPAQRMSLVHHRDIATATRIALTGAWDGRIVNITDEAPTSLYELVEIGGGAMDPSSQALKDPWRLHMDGGLARRLGFRPSVRTVHHAVEQNML
ncbi:NAD-dependent epimerase/dehydratase [Mycolicibacterium canariasense]|uniref:NAD-dependent epimerase/dehydratase n=1 Tax=Mycolicibacterium canariasense TaxID=228230 RepID=A0A100WCN1_MYCCR|nr:NAD(P)-dependent oxidoreductase [Mycolicibacterium canariasense]MCV7212565.1 NAD(P)-dependent oxidoreductase [Mycolicibacterium canariasense]ORV05371.1 epimerase [Mycolicibacterium canariasense]GAS95574.1 NAD-dependent epimerase/dehydratase [Mycolicibacterium canariasense]